MAANDILMDSAGFLALWDASDTLHRTAVRLHKELLKKRCRFFVTDYVADETAPLLRIRHSHSAAADFLETIERSESLHLEWITPDRFHAAVVLFRRYQDKEWSFTDCVSFVTMRELRIQEAFSSDHHFEQAGFVPLLHR